MRYVSTRGNYPPVPSAEAIRLGMVPKGGLFSPETVPPIDIFNLRGLSYMEMAFEILKLYLTDYTESEIQYAIAEAYSPDKFETINPAPLRMLRDNLAVLELWHGPTAAFKDLALQIMPHLLTIAAQKQKSEKEIVILVATSGDTGKAALEGFRDIPGTRIIVFYPKNGVSRVQELQMVTTSGSNTYTVGVTGNFDDCQTMVKEIFADPAIVSELGAAGFEFSSANSINWGRLVPQIVYYFWAYLQMVEKRKVFIGDPVNFNVPTGNFGNILAGYYAQQMGLPVNRFICSSNKNKILTDFIADGIYDKNREFHPTMSPSMDILISSNLERFLYSVTGNNPEKIVRWYDDLRTKGRFKVDETTRERVFNSLNGGFAGEQSTLDEIKRMYRDDHYLIDTHTAVASHVHRAYIEQTGDATPTIIASTASPFKFNTAVYQAITGDRAIDDEFVLLDKLQTLTGVPVHRSLEGLDKLPVRHNKVIGLKDGRAAIREILGLKP
ncbi:MAG: threonine synthase [Spirochaetes bacterium GWF1_49_6]|nr:MAG: threonine synthase [Spirochaetes bacterium GWF1_49_6]